MANKLSSSVSAQPTPVPRTVWIGIGALSIILGLLAATTFLREGFFIETGSYWQDPVSRGLHPYYRFNWMALVHGLFGLVAIATGVGFIWRATWLRFTAVLFWVFAALDVLAGSLLYTW